MEAELHEKTGWFTEDLKCFGVARMGFDDQKIVSGTLKDFLSIDMGAPLHSMVICSPDIHDLENEMFEFYRWKREGSQETEQEVTENAE